jgi:hypothetical protein
MPGNEGPSSQRRTKGWAKPKKAAGGPPKRIKTKNEPGGPMTPGAKKKRKKSGY